MKKKHNNKGFTLVELLVVIAIIGILAIVAVPALFKNIEKGKVSDLEADISALRSAALSYYAENSEYPKEKTEPVVLEKDKKVTDEQTATKSILEEVEGLSFPFDVSYTFSTESAPSELTITLKNKNKISESAVKKLESDLGKSNVKKNEKDEIVVTLINTQAPTSTKRN